jgi:uncharacterized cupredoxin-like copper-binding protein
MNSNARFSFVLLALTLMAGHAGADTGHEQMGGMSGSPGTHEHMEMNVPFGSPGEEAEVTKTIQVQATDQFRFVFDRTDIRRGDVVKFVVANLGKLRHEFSIGDVPSQRAHAAMMKKMPGMMHNDPNTTTLEPGETKTLVWKFDKAMSTDLVFACHEPGHYEAGMVQHTKLQK